MTANQKTGRQSFLHGAAVLGIAVAVVKFLGFLGKIPLINILGGDGYGHYNIAYSVYNVMLIISTAGLPVAVSKLVAEANAKGRAKETAKILRLALSVFLVVGLVTSGAMFLFAQQFADIMKSSSSAATIRAIAPSVFFLVVMSALRGYYQGMSNMYPTAVSQIIEALVKVVLGVALSWWLLDAGYPIEVAAAGAVGGMTVGTVLAMIYLMLRKAFDRRPLAGLSEDTSSSKIIVKQILAIAIPVTLGSGMLALTNFIDTLLVMSRLQTAAGFTQDQARWLYGSYGLAQTMFNFPGSFIVPFAVSVVPNVAAAVTRGDLKRASKTIETSIRITSILAFPAAAGLSVLAWPILNLLFSDRPDEVIAATQPLRVLGIAVFFNSVVMLTNSVLQSIGKVRIPVFTMLIGAVIKIAANWILVGIPEININGAPIGTTLCYATITILNLIVIARNIKPTPNLLRMFGRPLIATIVMAAGAWAVYGLMARFFVPKIAVLAAILVAVVVYFICVIAMRVVTKEDLLLLPKGEKIAKVLRIR